MGLYGLLLVAAVAGVASAQPTADDIERLYQDADLDSASAACRRIDEAEGWTRPRLVAALATCALVHSALQETAEQDLALARLVALEPSYRFDARATPQLVAALDRIRSAQREPIELTVRPELAPQGVRLVAQVRNDPGRLVRRVAIAGRVMPSRTWMRSENEPLLLVGHRPGAQVEYHAVATGPGGVEIARVGSEREPMTWTIPVPEGDRLATPTPATERTTHVAATQEPEAPRRTGFPWGWVAVGGGLVVAAAIVTVVVIGATQGGDTQPLLPTL
ncbi:MAG: hypothetical protein NZ898_01455 [Myxococcota bacterium]|nr:hypothetical protein [Myxococcota bacterium]MDW8362506.1 hypothetical protein [Myxococcales bacterium]